MNKNHIIFRSLVAVSLATMILFSACGSATTTPAPTAPPVPTVPPAPTTPPQPTETLPPAKVEGDLNVVTWAGYDSAPFTDPFYAKYPDVTINFSLIASDAEQFTKIQTGFQADVINPVWTKLYMENNLVQPIDTSRIESWSSIPDALKVKGQLNGVQYFVPFDWSYCSILVRTDKVTTMPTSWLDLWNPEYKGHVAITDGAEGGIVYTSMALGYDPYNLTDAQFAAVKQKMIDLKPNLLMYWADPYAMVQSVADGDLWVVGGAWASSYVMLKAQNVPVEYIEPKEGRAMWVGFLGITANSQNVDAAYAYANNQLSPAVQANVGGWGLGVANFDTIPLLDKNLVTQMGMDDISLLNRTKMLQDLSLATLDKWNAMFLEVKAAP